MKELIPIREENGKKAVSARDLHEFLESKRDFSNWIKDRINKYGLIENQDYEVYNNFGENPNGGRPLTEYALSIDTAKELSMVEGNAKGKQARQYFIACEKKLMEIAKPLSQLEIIAQSAQILLEQDKRLSKIEAEHEELKRGLAMIHEDQEQARFDLNYVPLSDEQVPELDTRRAINSLVAKYQSLTQLGYNEIWSRIYSKLYHNYRVSIKACKRNKGEAWLDVAERKGHLGKIYAIVSELVKSIKR